MCGENNCQRALSLRYFPTTTCRRLFRIQSMLSLATIVLLAATTARAVDNGLAITPQSEYSRPALSDGVNVLSTDCHVCLVQWAGTLGIVWDVT